MRSLPSASIHRYLQIFYSPSKKLPKTHECATCPYFFHLILFIQRSLIVLDGKLHLANNPWKCTCTLAWLPASHMNRNMRFIDDSTTLCSRPNHLNGKPVSITEVKQNVPIRTLPKTVSKFLLQIVAVHLNTRIMCMYVRISQVHLGFGLTW